MSFDDFDVKSVFREAARHVSGNGLMHFAIVGLNPDDNDQAVRNNLRDTFLIEPVFYLIRNNGGQPDHSEFVELINGISNAVGLPSLPLPQAHQGPILEAAPPTPEDLRRLREMEDSFLQVSRS